MPGTWAHLTRRFFWSLWARDLTSDEAEEVAACLEPAQSELFFAQGPADRRHGLDAARSARAAGADLETVRAAALHDVGKRQARLGVIGRSVASLLARLHLPAPGRFGVYLAHGKLGATDLANCGSSRLVVDFARFHHESRPESIPADVWGLLVRADHEVIGRGTRGG